ncbi:hypothetical protein PPACK8108_LOCUS16945 [Phakopsora pachyrhizi]|uniref:Uncharacterized protein n=1 Tax=Phakopsora pachyrhizi TaxID=170000 RepID=A0AAV0BB68_PHAPC|nr:hypothetical protein PPACK8108_LOCUS16945 [Phakopsora pachyrhizi]
MILQCPASEEATKLEIAKITESIKTFTNSSISQENPYQDITFLMQCSISPFTHPKTDNNASPITAWMSSCLIIYILQLSLFGTGVYYSRQSGSSRLFKRHDSGIIIPNTRILVATFSACLSIALIIDTILLILNANGSSVSS